MVSLKSRQPVTAGARVTTRCYSPNIELHWSSSATESEEWGVVSTALGARDWRRIDPLPARLSKGVKGASIPALYHWQRTIAPEWVWCESQAEKAEVMWLDFEGVFTKLWPQPFVICFPPDVSGAVSHTPDFLGATEDGRLALFDVRPADRIDERARRQFSLTAEVTETLGWPYEVLSGRETTATMNLEWLKASRHTRCAPPADALERILIAARDGATRAELLAIAAPHRPERANQWVDHLAWHRMIVFDLHARLENNTIFTAASTKEHS